MSCFGIDQSDGQKNDDSTDIHTAAMLTMSTKAQQCIPDLESIVQVGVPERHPAPL